MKKIVVVVICVMFVSAMFVQAALKVVVKSPNGGEKYEMGRHMNIKWRCTAKEGKGIIQLMYANGRVVKEILKFRVLASKSQSHTYRWKIPKDIKPSSKYKIRIRVHYKLRSESDVSDDFFTIKNYKPALELNMASRLAKIKVISPNGGETLYKGERLTVEWETDDDIGNPTLYIRQGSRMRLTMANIVPEGPFSGNRYRYSFSVPVMTIPNGTDYRLRIASNGSKPGMDESDRDFTITNQKIEVYAPLDGQRVARGDSMTIRWRAYNIDDRLKVWVQHLHPDYAIASNLSPTETSVIWNNVPVIDGVIPGGTRLRLVVSTMDQTIVGYSGWFDVVD